MPDLNCDALIIGSGQAGNPLAKALAEAGQKVILVEQHELGGSCLNYGCVPTKMLLASAERAQQVRTAGELGILASQPPRVDMAAVQARKRALQAESRQKLEQSLAPSHPGLRVLRGPATFVGERRVRILTAPDGAEQLVTARQVFINTGTRPAVPDLPGLADASYLTTNELLEIEEVPARLLILGGGYIGLEFGQLFRRLGSEVVVVDTGAQVLEREDDDVCEALQAGLEAEGVDFVLNGQARRVSRAADGTYTLTVDTPAGERRLRGSHLLVATGRQPNTDKLNLAATGVKTDEKGFIPVNSRLETRVPGIYALGDVHGGPQFTHLSYDDFRVLRANLLEQGPRRSARQRPLPYCVFTDPSLGRIGLSENQAREKKLKYRVAKMPVSIISRAQQTGEQAGFWKIIVGPDDRLLGAAIVGPAAGEIMTLLQVAMLGRLRYPQLAEMVVAHPVWAEGLNVAFRELS